MSSTRSLPAIRMQCMLLVLAWLTGNALPLRAQPNPSPAGDVRASVHDQDTAEGETPPAALSPEAERIAAQLSEQLAPGTEARAMFDAIMAGQRLRPNTGWFALAKSQSKYGWAETQKRFDSNSDSRIDAVEFTGSEQLFQAVDRDHDGSITAEDFDWESPHSPQAGLDDQRAQRRSPPSREVLIKALHRQEIGSLQPGPNVGDLANDFELPTYDGSTSVRLSEVVGDKPVVLVFGNFTCGPFRRESAEVKDLFDRYREHAEFLMIYVREAHPVDGWHFEDVDARYLIPQPVTAEQRHQVAATCRAEIEFEMPFLVDGLDDPVGRHYSGMPSRLYLLDKAGRVLFKSGRGPHGFKPSELEQALALQLAAEEQTPAE